MTAINLTDAERSFMDSAEGRSAIAYARMIHDGAAGHHSNGAHPFTDAMAAAAVRKRIADVHAHADAAAAYKARADLATHARNKAHRLMIDRECGRTA